jgi:hypothetical protein
MRFCRTLVSVPKFTRFFAAACFYFDYLLISTEDDADGMTDSEVCTFKYLLIWGRIYNRHLGCKTPLFTRTYWIFSSCY